MKIDDRVVVALLRLRSPEFEPLLAYLADLRKERLEQLAAVTDQAQVYRYQGRAHELAELLKFINDAEKYRDNLERKRS